jgi:hypothetical protein
MFILTKGSETMVAMNATQVRSEWSAVVDTVVRDKPQFIKRTRDYMVLADLDLLLELLSAYMFNATIYEESDGSITISLDEIDLVENGTSKQDAINKLSSAILEYAIEYYNDFQYWSKGNRSKHKPYIFKVLILNDIDKIGGIIQCHPGKI